MNFFTVMTAVQDTAASHSDDNWIIEHISDSKYLHLEPFVHDPVKLPEFPPINIGGISIDLSITKSVLMMMIGSVILVVILTIAARQNKKNRIPKGFGNFIEMIMLFLRDEVVLPSMGHHGVKFLPFFFTLFMFIITVNMLGLIPYMATPTGNVNVTAGLAIITFIMMNLHGIISNGLFGYFKGLVPHGIPLGVLPIMIVVEFLGLLTRPFALAIRLFANMTAGHVVILALIGLIFTLGYAVTPVSIVFSLFIYLLELLVAFLQAYIFTMLSALFIGMSIHQEH